MRATKVDKVDKGRHNSKLFKRGVKINMHTSGKFNKSLKKRRDRTEPKYRALDMTEHALKVAIRTIDRHAGKDTRKHIPN